MEAVKQTQKEMIKQISDSAYEIKKVAFDLEAYTSLLDKVGRDGNGIDYYELMLTINIQKNATGTIHKRVDMLDFD